MTFRTPAAALGLAIAVAACGESLDSGPVCPTLCPGPVVDLRETVIEPVVLDTVIGPLPPLGVEAYMLAADRPGIAETFGVVRFDTLFTRYNPPDEANDTTTVPITALDSAYLRLRFDTTTTIATQPVTIELFDVSAVAGDTVAAAFVAAIEGATPFADTTFAAATLLVTDSLRLEIPKEFMQGKVNASAADPTLPFRIAIRVTSAEPAQLRIHTMENRLGGFPLLVYDPAPADTAVRPISLQPYSKTPTGDAADLRARLRDFTIYASATPPPGAGELAVGGLPGKRSYFRFDIPTEIIDSTTIVRATLVLHPTGTAVGTDTLNIVPQIGTAGPVIDDPRRQTLLAVDVTGSPYFVDTVKVEPGSTDSVTVDIVNLVARTCPSCGIWAAVGVDTLPRVLVLRAAGEGSIPEQVVFHSIEAADPALRPRLRIRYIPVVDFGLP